MKLTYLGTAAAEGFPAVFCNCEHCRDARILGGKNIRTRSQALINDDLLIDLPADTYHHFLTSGIDGGKIRHLLITHSHSDHFYPSELSMRHDPYAHNMEAPVMEVYAGGEAYARLTQAPVPPNVTVQRILPFETLQVGNYQVTGFPARHADGDGALIYLIQSDVSILYAHDTGYFYDEVIEDLAKKQIKLDLISFDCTNVGIVTSNEGRHMGIDTIFRLEAKLRSLGVITDQTTKIINHFSHNARPIHHEMEQRVGSHGYLVSYDGMEVTVSR